MTELNLNAGVFRVLLLHSADLCRENAAEKASLLEKRIEEGKPDLIVCNGDLFSSPVKEEDAKFCLSIFLSPAVRRGIPWTAAFGEGERKTGLSDTVLDRLFRESEGFLPGKRAEGIDGVTNAVLPVTDGRGPALILRLFDTHSETTAYEREYGSPGRSRLPYPLFSHHYMDGVRFNQTAWFDADHEKIREECGREIPEVFFFHTPTPEHAQIPLNQECTRFDGVIREDGKCQTVNGGIAMAAAESGSVLGIFCGHERENDWFASFAGMTFGVEPAFDTGAWTLEITEREVRVHRLRN